MSKRIVWTTKALVTFENIIEYLNTDYGNKEVENFIIDTSNIIKNIKLFPQMHIKLSSIGINKAP